MCMTTVMQICMSVHPHSSWHVVVKALGKGPWVALGVQLLGRRYGSVQEQQLACAAGTRA